MLTGYKTYAMSQSGKARFIAIRVGQGDAFFIERTDKLALVDGGRSRVGFATQFKKVTGLEYVDILVCTHNDADHALGLLGFLECGFTAREVWLPASWTDRLDDLLLHPSEFLGELIGNIEESETKEMQLTNLGDSYSTNAPHRERDQEELNEVDAENLSLTFEAASERPMSGICYCHICQPILTGIDYSDLCGQTIEKIDSLLRHFQQPRLLERFL
jgi:hypothetical protein